MTDKEIKLVVAALLHDIGKVVFRGGDTRKHSITGYDFLKNEAGILEEEILNSVRYHHGEAIAKADIDKAALAYIVYIADNIAAATERRENDSEEKGFDRNIPLQSVFNILNGHNDKFHYNPAVLEDNGKIIYPTDGDAKFDATFYQKIQRDFLDTLKGVDVWDMEYISSLLSMMEAYLTYIPSSTALHELVDISLYDHVKMTAAYSSCIYQYLEDKGETNYKDILFKEAKEFYNQPAFRLFSMDISGIQSFIYTIHSEKALRMLRSRSFYLEVLMEDMIDDVLEQCHLSRANLIYSGGGHAYILMPNTEVVCQGIEKVREQFNQFLLDKFDVSLYVAMASVACSAMDLQNVPEGSYAGIFEKISLQLSQQKSSRYTAKQLIELNEKSNTEKVRECKICKTTSNLTEENVCQLCRNLMDFSNDILYQDFFTVVQEERVGALALPNDRYLIGQKEKELRETMEKDDYYVRSYGKNKLFTGKSITTKLWVGDYVMKSEDGKYAMNTEEYAKQSEGIDRIAVLRADVDNLGTAFVSGFPEKYTTLSRTATFSRHLSLFFKHHINAILKNGKYKMEGKNGPRKASVVYSGGDDLFIVGAWNDVIELAIDIKEALSRYTCNTLTLSCGIGIYAAKYPLSSMAREVAELEEQSKKYPNPSASEKNAITLLREEIPDTKIVSYKERHFNGSYHWEEFTEKVLGEKLKVLSDFFEHSDERGKAFLYRLLDLIRDMEQRINLARFAYVLARLEPDKKDDLEQWEHYQDFSKKMYQWVQNEEDKRQLITAIYLYVYLKRNGGEEE